MNSKNLLLDQLKDSIKHEEFLRELSELTIKHGFEIDGCGCCGSPFLSEGKYDGHYTVDPNMDNLVFNRSNDEYKN